jgi:hypothetical protein
MSVKLVTAGFVMAGLVSAGAVTVLVVSQPAPVRQVQFVAPVDSTPTATVAPVVVPTTEAPASVESTTAPAPVAAPTSEAPVAVKAPAPAPAPKPYVMATGPNPAGPPQEPRIDPAQDSPPGGFIGGTVQPAPTPSP